MKDPLFDSLVWGSLRLAAIITPNSKVIFVTRVYGIKCTVVSQKSTYVRSTLHDHQRAGMGPPSFKCSCIHLFKCLYILSCSHMPTLSHTHILTHTHPSHTHIDDNSNLQLQ